MSNRDDHYFIYVKDSNGKHTGITICVMSRDGKIWHGQSNCSPEDQFEKSVGRKLAYERAVADYERNMKLKEEEGTYTTEKSIWLETCGSSTFTYNVEKKEKKNDKTITLSTNKELDSQWWKDNAFIGEIHDDGNGITLILANGIKERNNAIVLRLDYSQWENFAHLYKLSHEDIKWASQFDKIQQERTIP